MSSSPCLSLIVDHSAPSYLSAVAHSMNSRARAVAGEAVPNCFNSDLKAAPVTQLPYLWGFRDALTTFLLIEAAVNCFQY